MFLKDFLFSVVGEYTPITYEQIVPVFLADGSYDYINQTFSYGIDWPWIIAAIAFILSVYLIFQFFIKGFIAILKR